MAKFSVRILLVLACVLAGVFSASSAKAEKCSGPDYSSTDGNGVPIVCFQCETATYCYYTN
jgi:hypothetical protein